MGAGNKMAQWLFNVYIIARSTLRLQHVHELHSPEYQNKYNVFGALIERRWCTSINPPPVSTTRNDNIWEEHEDNYEWARIIPNIEDTVDSKGR